MGEDFLSKITKSQPFIPKKKKKMIKQLGSERGQDCENATNKQYNK